ncbi:C45 family autoproteolytic acyltransferase/hydolase [Candidatus Solincola sp.]|nr:C45 family autoproteolytic acyltransferase/hydrolase [Actinomycetota bacterium]
MVILLLTFFLPLPGAAWAGTGPAANHRPVASISAPGEVVRGERVELDGTGSRDPEGDALTYQWVLAAKPSGSAAELSDPTSPRTWFTADVEGVYRVRLRVSDGSRTSRPAVARIRVVYGRLSNPVSSDEYRPVARLGNSYLAENEAGKRLLFLEGDAYQRGYATGKLCPRSVYRITHDFIFNLIGEMLPTVGINLDPQTVQNLVRFLWPLLQLIVTANMDAVPPEFLDEMRGMADACREEGYDVSFQDVLTLNLGFDVLESVFVGFAALFCNEFAVSGRATPNGTTFHGRDFMFPTGGGVFSDEALLIVHKPESGYPFIASAAPGFVGVPTALNSRGVSCGMDMVASVLFRPIITGEGALLLCRKAVQYGGSLEEAVALIRDSDRAVPWLYMITDGRSGQAVVLETTASSLAPPEDLFKSYLARFFSGLLQALFPWLSQEGAGSVAATPGVPGSLPGLTDTGLQAILEGDDVLDQRGVMVRDMAYTDPQGLVDLVRWMVESGNSTVEQVLPLQEESYPDLVAMTNHYILPWKAITYPSLRPQKYDSIWRYRTMLELLLEGYGRIDVPRAMWIIDFLNPARCDYYGTDTTQSVKGHHVLMDNADHEMWSLHGHYDQPWAHADLDDFLK